MLPTADIVAPERVRRLGAAWFVLPLVLVGVWLIAAPHRPASSPHANPAGVAADR